MKDPIEWLGIVYMLFPKAESMTAFNMSVSGSIFASGFRYACCLGTSLEKGGNSSG